MKTRTRRLVSLAVGAIVAGGCSSAPAALRLSPGRPAVAVAAPVPFRGDRRVFVEGDSLTVGIEPFLPGLLASAGWSVTLDAEVGRATATGVGVLAEQASEIGGTLVIALGTNDLPDPIAFSSRIDEVMSIASSRRVIWVTVARAGWDGLDRALAAAPAQWPNLRVIDWRPVIAAHPDLQAADGIHLTEAGYQLRAQFVASAVQSN